MTGLPDEDLGSAPHALIQTTDDISDEALVQHCRERLSASKVPRTFDRRAIPLRDEAGKVRRSALRQERLGRTHSPQQAQRLT